MRKKPAANRRTPTKWRKIPVSLFESIAWIRALAAPYLQGYRPVRTHAGPLIGYWFYTSPPKRSSKAGLTPGLPPHRGKYAGFFVGYLVQEQGFLSLSPQPPECIIFAWVHPVDGLLHRRLVRESGSLARKTFEYICWLTHRPPRFVFHEDDLLALTRHQSMHDWPADNYTHLSRNFFIETLAWLVRSGLVRKLHEETR